MGQGKSADRAPGGVGALGSLNIANTLQDVQSLHRKPVQQVNKDPILREFVAIASIDIDDSHIGASLVAR